MCSTHYQRWKKYGDTETVKSPPSPAKDWIRNNIKYEADECLKWPFYIDKNGYGCVHKMDGSGRLTTAANVICEAANGPRPSSRHECAHNCGKGNEGCVAPNHLRWALPEENQADRVEHGTSNRGEQQGASKLTQKEVLEIRRRAMRETQASLAREFLVGPDHISRIVNRKVWGWLP
jgi:hypothetical protein